MGGCGSRAFRAGCFLSSFTPRCGWYDASSGWAALLFHANRSLYGLIAPATSRQPSMAVPHGFGRSGGDPGAVPARGVGRGRQFLQLPVWWSKPQSQIQRRAGCQSAIAREPKAPLCFIHSMIHWVRLSADLAGQCSLGASELASCLLTARRQSFNLEELWWRRCGRSLRGRGSRCGSGHSGKQSLQV